MILQTNAVFARLLPILLLTLLLAAGCSDMGDPVSPNDNNNGNGDPTPADTLSWTGDIYPDIISTYCISCHSSSIQLGNLDLTDFAGWIDANSLSGNPYVVPGDPDASELVWRVEGTNGLQRMPQGGQLASSEIEAIRTWIEQGALEQ